MRSRADTPGERLEMKHASNEDPVLIGRRLDAVLTMIYVSEYDQAVSNRANRWVPACGGYETPFSHNGTEWLYVFNPSLRQHGYLNMREDIVYDQYM